MEIHFTKHAEDKFKILTRHGVRIPKSKVIDTIEYPDIIDHSRLLLLIAQSNLDRSHVLRIVYKKRERFNHCNNFLSRKKITI